MLKVKEGIPLERLGEFGFELINGDYTKLNVTNNFDVDLDVYIDTETRYIMFFPDGLASAYEMVETDELIELIFDLTKAGIIEKE